MWGMVYVMYVGGWCDVCVGIVCVMCVNDVWVI